MDHLIQNQLRTHLSTGRRRHETSMEIARAHDRTASVETRSQFDRVLNRNAVLKIWPRPLQEVLRQWML